MESFNVDLMRSLMECFPESDNLDEVHSFILRESRQASKPLYFCFYEIGDSLACDFMTNYKYLMYADRGYDMCGWHNINDWVNFILSSDGEKRA